MRAVPIVHRVDFVELAAYEGGQTEGSVRAGELLLINPGERHTYRAERQTAAFMVFAGLPGVRARTWTLRQR